MGEAILMVPSTEVRTWCCAARAWRLEWLFEGWTPPAVDGRAGGCAKGEFLPVEGGANWDDSLEVVERLDSLLREACESEDCDLWPEGECGLGGGRRGGRLFIFALVILRDSQGRGQPRVSGRTLSRHLQLVLRW